MTWLKRLTPFRVAVILFLGYQLVLFFNTPSNFNGGGGSAWGGVALIAMLFWGTVLWLVDLLMRKLIKDHWIVFVIQLLALLAMFLFLDC
ncbi:MAG: hypothetical protein JST45_04060 [Bacteroidetes bacterium]|nr:hypothetical protein [Bacteroidota bacterium]